MDEMNHPIVAIFFWLGIGTLFLLFAPAVMIVLGGVVFSPVAGLISGRLARRRGLNLRRYTVVGVAYSIMFGFPWLCLTFGMLDWNIPRLLIRMLYVLLYVAWMCACLMWVIFFFFVIDEEPSIIRLVIVSFGAGASIIGWFVSLRILMKTGVGSLAEWGSPEEGIVPYTRYLQPFAWIMLSLTMAVADYFLPVYLS